MNNLIFAAASGVPAGSVASSWLDFLLVWALCGKLLSSEVESRERRVISGNAGALGTVMAPSPSEPRLTWIRLMLRIRWIICYVLLEFFKYFMRMLICLLRFASSNPLFLGILPIIHPSRALLVCPGSFLRLSRLPVSPWAFPPSSHLPLRSSSSSAAVVYIHAAPATTCRFSCSAVDKNYRKTSCSLSNLFPNQFLTLKLTHFV